MSAELRAARDALVGDPRRRGIEFGAAMSTLVDEALISAAAALKTNERWALLALGSYARRELCPGSDVDVMLLHAGGRRGSSLTDDASLLWYPLWDAGFVLGHSVRTVREAVSLADGDLDALTALLDTRWLAGDTALAGELVERMRALAPRRRGRLIDELAGGAAARLVQPGPIAEMLAPNLKDGGGGLRDIQAPGWVGWVLGATVAPASGSSRDLPEGLAGEGWSHGVHALAAQGFLRDGDVQRLRDARDLLLDARVALHRVSGGKSEQLTLQDQDAVAQLLGVSDSDVLLRSIGEAARAVTWIGTDLWTRLRSAERGPTGRGPGEHRVNDLVTLRDGRVWLARDATIDAATALAVAARAAELGAPFERDTLERLATLNEVEWTPTAREEFIALLRAGRGAIPVFETLDHEALLVRLLPEWAHVRARPQRNAYHRFTVDRHSLEAVAECVAVLDDAVVDQAGGPDRGFDARVAGQARPDVLLLAALLHDVGKGRPGDHSVVGVEYARAIAERIGLDDQGTDELSWLVRNHLLLADTATRRDLSDETTISRFGEAVATTERLDALYVLTLGDSRATGPAAWSTSKAALVRELYSKTRQWLTDGVVQSDTVRADQLLAEFADLRAARVPAVRWQEAGHGMLRCVVVAPDRTGLLATVTGSLTLLGFDVEHAAAFTDDGGMAVETFTGAHRFGRLDTDDERARASAAVLAALDGDVGLDQGLRDRAQRYRTAVTRPDQRNIRVTIDNDASKAATLVEVFAPDDVGVLARVAAVFAGLGLDVGQAIVSTHGDRVVDVFYLRDARGAKIVDDRTLDELRSTVLERLASEVSLD